MTIARFEVSLHLAEHHFSNPNQFKSIRGSLVLNFAEVKRIEQTYLALEKYKEIKLKTDALIDNQSIFSVL